MRTALPSQSLLIRSASGKALGHSRPGEEYSSICIDSRKCRKGSLFVPLGGRFTNGHNYIEDALKNGASAALVGRDYSTKNRSELSGLGNRYKACFIEVAEVLNALQQFARAYVEELNDVYRIGVSGSNGKTTTKECIASVLSRQYKTFVNQGNFNSEIGLPLSVLHIRKEDCYAVCEMGMNHPGEMSLLSDIFKPHAALLTNIGTAHIGELGSREKIAYEKKQIFKNFTPESIAFLNGNDSYTDYLAEGLPCEVVLFGAGYTRGFEGIEDRGLDGNVINWEGLRIFFPLPGKYNVENALAAISLCSRLGIAPELIKEGLEGVKPLFARSEILRGETSFIMDCYNANPDSVRKSLDFLKSLSWEGRKIAILGSMKELGENTQALHREIAGQAQKAELDAVYFVGEEYGFVQDLDSDHREEVLAEQPPLCWYPDVASLKQELAEKLSKGDLVLIKGSRSLEMERLTENFKTERGE